MIKKILINATLISIGLVAHMNVQAKPGIYIGGNAGYGTAGDTSFNHGGFAYNGDIGYQFNTYFGLELGYNHFANETHLSTWRTDSLSNYSGDIALKATLPVADRWSLFGKAGLAYVHHEAEYFHIANGNTNLTLPLNGSISGPAPYLAAGASYELSQHLDLNAQIHGTTHSQGLPSMYAGLVGLSYRFD